MSRYRFEPLDFSGITTYPLQSRPSKVTADDLARPSSADSTIREFLDSLPNILAARDLGETLGPYPTAAALARESHYKRFAPFYRAPWAYGAALVLFLFFRPPERAAGVTAAAPS